MRCLTTLLAAVAGVIAVGCEPADEWPRAAVEGQVTLNGEPLSQGQITFFPAGPNSGPAAGGEIVAGKFSLEKREGPVVGHNRIEIRSVQKTGRMVKSPVAVEADGVSAEGMMVEEYLDIVPSKYNTYSELKKEIEDGKINQLDFSLTK